MEWAVEAATLAISSMERLRILDRHKHGAELVCGHIWSSDRMLTWTSTADTLLRFTQCRRRPARLLSK
jgi:hypothetical protein